MKMIIWSISKLMRANEVHPIFLFRFTDGKRQPISDRFEVQARENPPFCLEPLFAINLINLTSISYNIKMRGFQPNYHNKTGVRHSRVDNF